MNPRLRNPGVGLLALGLLWVALYWMSSPHAQRASADGEAGPVLARQTESEGASPVEREDRPESVDRARRPDPTPPPPVGAPRDERTTSEAPPPEPDEPAPEYGAYTVRDGDSLSVISQRLYGTARHWRLLYEANRDRIPDPDRLRVGTELRVPPLPDGR